jgi:hypothetical protein
MTDSEKRRAEAIKAYQKRQAKAAEDAEEQAERDRQRQARWGRIVAAVMRANDAFVREGSPLRLMHCPPDKRYLADGTYESFQIHRVEYLQEYPDKPSNFALGTLEFSLDDDGRVSIETSHDSPNILDELDFDDLTESLAEQIASELMIAVLNDDRMV